MGLDAQGNAVAVWTSYGTWRRTQAATRPVGGSWSTPITFSVPDEKSGWNPRVAVAANGDAVAVWSSTRLDTDRQITMAATREAGGGWSAPVELSLHGNTDIGLSYQPAVVVDAQGTATAIWSEDMDYGEAILTSTRPHGGDWSAPVELTVRADLAASKPQLAVDPQGDVTAVWIRNEWEYLGGIAQSATRPAGGSAWSAPVDLSASDLHALWPQVSVDAQGDAVAVWQTEQGVQAAWRTPADGWSQPVDLYADGKDPDVAIDPQGTATAVWETQDDIGTTVHASTSTLGGTWSAPVDVSVRDDSPSQGAEPQVTTDPQGNVTAIWKNFYEPFYNRVTAARREAGGNWSAPVQIGPSNGAIEPTRVAADPQGYVTAMWSKGTQIFASVYDAVAPQLNNVAVPPRGVGGQPVTMSVDPFDVWPPVAVRWDFGDGGSGTGATIQHCYSTAGEHTVTLTGTDGAGNATNAQRTIQIEPDPALAAGIDPCVAAEPEPGPGPGPDPGPAPSPGPAPDPGPGPGVTAPQVSDLHQSSSRWRTRTVDRPPHLPVGTTFRFRLDRAAGVHFAFARIVPGRRVAERCVKATKANRTKPRCSRYRSRGALSIDGAGGSNAYRFRGRIGGGTLEPGRYRLLVTALRDGRRSAAVAIAFTIAR